MKFSKVLTPLAVLLGLSALAATSSAQLVTYETLSTWNGSVQTLNANAAYVQTFSNVTEIQSMTFRFTASSSSTLSSVNAYFAEWDSSTNAVVGAQLMTLGSGGVVSVPASGDWTTTFVDSNGTSHTGFDYQFNLNYTTDPLKTYALILNTSTATGVGIASVIPSTTFAYGSAATIFGGVTDYNSLATAGATNGAYSLSYQDWGFSQIVVAPYVSPIPESRTAAALFSVMFVGMLACRRRYQPRDSSLSSAV